jgi:hypothetical protein
MEDLTLSGIRSLDCMIGIVSPKLYQPLEEATDCAKAYNICDLGRCGY